MWTWMRKIICPININTKAKAKEYFRGIKFTLVSVSMGKDHCNSRKLSVEVCAHGPIVLRVLWKAESWPALADGVFFPLLWCMTDARERIVLMWCRRSGNLCWSHLISVSKCFHHAQHAQELVLNEQCTTERWLGDGHHYIVWQMPWQS